MFIKSILLFFVYLILNINLVCQTNSEFSFGSTIDSVSFNKFQKETCYFGYTCFSTEIEELFEKEFPKKQITYLCNRKESE